jgi:alkylation response protein AidB-like acyl-CoA dehydrogenase
MDLRLTPAEQAFRDEVRAWLKAALPEDLRRKVVLGQRPSREDIIRWQRILNEKGWAAPSWPVEYGGTGWDATQLYLFKEEMQRAFAPEPLGMNVNLVGPVIIAFGSEEQKREFLPKIRNLDLWFCQGFSEPSAGSDLASLKTTAVLEGDHYVVNGSKLWTSNAHRADWMFALVRTDPGAKKQKGITYLLIDMKSPGLSLHPVITMDGDRWCNQEFFDNVRVPVVNRIGEENKGWNYAKYLLGHERVNFGKVGATKARIGLAKSLAAKVSHNGRPLSEDEAFCEKLAWVEVELKALEITNMQVVAAMKLDTAHRQDPKASILKIKGGELYQMATEILMQVAGPDAMARQTGFLKGEVDETVGPDWAATTSHNYYMMRERTIAGGSSEVQHNIIAKAILGL